jgi:beta-lactamase class A
MTTSRRAFLATGLAAAGWPAMSPGAEAAIPRRGGGLEQRILQEFGKLPGRTALVISVPAVDHAPAWSVSLNRDQLLFCASAFKAFVLAEYLRQTETGFLINWVDGEGGTSGEVRPLGVEVLRSIFTWLRDAFGTCR